MSIIRRSRLPHMVFCAGCAGCGCVELGHKLFALCEWYRSTVHTVRTACDRAAHNHSQHNQYRTPYAVIHGLVLLMMGIMIAETCWDRSLIINIGLVASCWFISPHPTFHDAPSQEPKTDHVRSKCPYVRKYHCASSWQLLQTLLKFKSILSNMILSVDSRSTDFHHQGI
jgi:hypothetical protein